MTTRRNFLGMLLTAPVASLALPTEAFKPVLIAIDCGGGDDFTAVAFHDCDLNFVAARQFQIEEIARIFAVPVDAIMPGSTWNPAVARNDRRAA